LKRLFLLRHAKSDWGDPGVADHDRPLASRGQKAARRLAVHVRHVRVRPELVLCSSARRALQTYEAIAPALGRSFELSVEDGLYGATAEDLLVRLQSVPKRVTTTMLIGHNPGLQDLALAIAGDGDPAALAQLAEKFPTGALASLNAPGEWRSLGPGTAYLESLTVPRDLPG
jgi:phosphohistidine phosphatase